MQTRGKRVARWVQVGVSRLRRRADSTWHILVVLVVVGLLLSACAPGKVTEPTATTAPTAVPTAVPRNTPAATPTPQPTAVPAAPTPRPTATRPAIAEITLRPGDYYFSIDGRPGFVFSRNLAAYTMSDFSRLLQWSKRGGSRVARLQLSTVVAGGRGYTPAGVIDEAWARKWEKVFDTADENGVYIMVVFTGWYDWNTTGFNDWANNPFNAANGGPATKPAELFESDSAAQTLWLAWLKAIVSRWQGRRNILAWEIYSEVNLTQGVTEPAGVEFVERAAEVIREADPARRPITASLADMGEWPSFYHSSALDFINIHPYPPSGRLDLAILDKVGTMRAKYQKPVMIGESGLSAETPDSQPPTLTTAERAGIGIRHALWAAAVSGSMNGRALYWEDGYGVYFPALSWPYLQTYMDIEAPVAQFLSDTDWTGFVPLPARVSNQIVGGAVGNDRAAIGWFRDAGCEPPDWPLRPVVSKQSVTLTVSGAAAQWQVDFYTPETGAKMGKAITVTRKGANITVPLPDFKDDIAFKMSGQPGVSTAPATDTPALATTDPIAGQWRGSISGEGGFGTPIELTVKPGCQVGRVCGTVSVPELPCSGDLALTGIRGSTFTFIEQNMGGSESCVSGGTELLTLQADGTLLFQYTITLASGQKLASSGVLMKSPD